jgi:RHS repeat-associated protein
VAPGTDVTFTTSPNAGARFEGYDMLSADATEPCGGTPACTLRILAPTELGARFGVAPTERMEFQHTDALGSIRAVTNEAGVRTVSNDFTPFGEQVPYSAGDPLNTRRLFAGKERDAESGLDYVGARYYASRTGRFTTVDPVFDRQSALSDPQRWNRYVYAKNSPLRFFDPDGRDTRVLIGKDPGTNPFGHAAIAINGVVFSYGTDFTHGPKGKRDWGASLEAYLAAQANKRQTEILTLDLSPEQETRLLSELQLRNPYAPGEPKYGLLTNSCVTACQSPIRDLGLLPGAGPVKIDRAGNELQAGGAHAFTPEGFADDLRRAGLVKESKIVGTPQISLMQALWYAVLNALP